MSHWYTADGGAAHGANDAEAAERGLLPSVTAIIGQLAAPALVDWRIGQAIEIAEAAPRLKSETAADFASRVSEEAARRLAEAAETGRGVHAAIEASLAGESMEAEHAVHAAPAVAWFQSTGWTPVAVERVVVGAGYAGTMDMAFIDEAGRPGVLDWKTKRTKPGRRAFKSEEHGMQLAAYAMAFHGRAEGVRLVNVAVSVTEPGRIEVLEHDGGERLHAMFAALVELWWRRNRNAPPPKSGKTKQEDASVSEMSENVIEEYMKAKRALDDAQENLDARRKALEDALGDRDSWQCQRFQVFRKRVAGRRTFNVEGFAKDNPQLDLGPYYKVGAESVRLSIKEQEVMF